VTGAALCPTAAYSPEQVRRGDMSKGSLCGSRDHGRPAHVSARILPIIIAASLVLTCSTGCRAPKQRAAPRATNPAAKPAVPREVAPHPPFRRVWLSRADFAAEDTGPEGLYGGPLITDRVLYRVLHEGGAVRAVDHRTGKVLWQKQTERGSIPAYDGKTVYVAAKGKLVACDALTGHERWSVPLLADLPPAARQIELSPIAARPGSVFCGRHRLIVAFDTTKRKRTWTIELPYMPQAFTIRGRPYYYVRPIIAADRYLIFTGDFGIVCIEIEIGRLRWHYPPEGRSARRPGEPDLVVPYYAVSGIAADSARLYFMGAGAGTGGPETGALDLRTGRLLWKAATMWTPARQAPAPLRGLALFVGKDRRLHAVNAADGKPRWEFASPEGKLHLSRPTVYGGQIFLHTGKALMALDASGRTLWTWRTQDGDTPNPTRITVFNDGVLLHERGTFVYYAMVKPPAAKAIEH